MQLLARTGRRTEALRAFRDARSALAEFGMEPGSELRRTERAIVLDESTTDDVRPPAAVQMEGCFVDREDTLAELADAIVDGPRDHGRRVGRSRQDARGA